MAAKTKCPLCDEEVWGFDLTAHLWGHLPYKMPKEYRGGYDYCRGGYECWCGQRFVTFKQWQIHLIDHGGWRAHYAACLLGLEDGIDLTDCSFDENPPKPTRNPNGD